VDSIIDYAQWQGPAGTVDKQPVFPNHAAALRTRAIFWLNRQLFFHKLFKVVFHSQPPGRSQGLQRGGDFGMWSLKMRRPMALTQCNAHCLHHNVEACHACAGLKPGLYMA
jgi:hypothetical protein